MPAHIINKKKRTSDISSCIECDFDSLLLSSNVLSGLKKCGFIQPSPIQIQTIPLAKCGVDLVCQAKSGTGKTCVFAVSALETVDVRLSVTQVLVLAPTREIAHQIHGVITSIGCCVDGLKCGLFIGGISMKQDFESIKRCHVAIGTPGRVRHLIEKGCLVTSSIRLFVLDEADKLLEKGSFEEQINWIFSTLPQHKQVLALSATYPEELANHLNNYMQDAVHVRINSADVVLKGVMQYFLEVEHVHLSNKLFDSKCRVLVETISKLPFQQCMVFSNFHSRAERLCQVLNKKGWPSTFIAGSQQQSERLKAIAKLKEYNCRILITTDLTARGIDCDQVNLVISLDLPFDTETYFHRVGRAGRFGSYGMAISIISSEKEKEKLKEIEASMNRKILPLPLNSDALLRLWESVANDNNVNKENLEDEEEMQREHSHVSTAENQCIMDMMENQFLTSRNKNCKEEKEPTFNDLQHAVNEERGSCDQCDYEVYRDGIRNINIKDEKDCGAVVTYTTEKEVIDSSNPRLKNKTNPELQSIPLGIVEQVLLVDQHSVHVTLNEELPAPVSDSLHTAAPKLPASGFQHVPEHLSTSDHPSVPLETVEEPTPDYQLSNTGTDHLPIPNSDSLQILHFGVDQEQQDPNSVQHLPITDSLSLSKESTPKESPPRESRMIIQDETQELPVTDFSSSKVPIQPTGIKSQVDDILTSEKEVHHQKNKKERSKTLPKYLKLFDKRKKASAVNPTMKIPQVNQTRICVDENVTLSCTENEHTGFNQTSTTTSCLLNQEYKMAPTKKNNTENDDDTNNNNFHYKQTFDNLQLLSTTDYLHDLSITPETVGSSDGVVRDCNSCGFQRLSTTQTTTMTTTTATTSFGTASKLSAAKTSIAKLTNTGSTVITTKIFPTTESIAPTQRSDIDFDVHSHHKNHKHQNRNIHQSTHQSTHCRERKQKKVDFNEYVLMYESCLSSPSDDESTASSDDETTSTRDHSSWNQEYFIHRYYEAYRNQIRVMDYYRYFYNLQ